jgi:hypothetical protein
MTKIAIAKLFACAALLTFAAVPGHAAAVDGKKLHDTYCSKCHDSNVYTRKDHFVQSRAMLERQLGKCSHMIQHEFSPEENQALLKYLNDNFYKFP